MKLRQRLLVEELETRLTPAAFGFPWPDASHLTISFVPDGTVVGAGTSQLHQMLDAQMPTAVWEAAILRAFQTWAVNVNANIALVPDGGQALGTPGAPQGDSRFGDIRVAAVPLGPDSLSSAVPFGFGSGTWSGELLLNSDDLFSADGRTAPDLYSVALHEAGHVFGLDDNNDLTSVMFPYYNGVRAGLSAADMQAEQALYGARTPDRWEGPWGNDSWWQSTPFRLASLAQFKGQLSALEPGSSTADLVPLAVNADLSSLTDVDNYTYWTTWRSPDFTVHLQTTGQSLLQARVTVYDTWGRVVDSVAATDPMNGDLTVRVSGAQRWGFYRIKVEGATDDGFGIGAYRLQVVPDSPEPLQPFNQLLGQFQQRAPFANDSLATATTLVGSSSVTDDRFDYYTTGELSSSSDVDYYRFTAPDSGGVAQSMTLSVWAKQTNGLQPTVVVYDSAGQVVAADVLSNGDGQMTVRIANALSGATYFVAVRASDPAQLGTYALGIDFTTRSTDPETFATGTITASSLPPSVPLLRAFALPAAPPALGTPGQQDFRWLHVNEGSTLHLEFSADTPNATVETAVEVTLFDRAGNVLLDKVIKSGQAASVDLFLTPGDYVFRFVAGTQDGSRLPALNYQVRGLGLNEPIGPELIDPTMPPTRLPAFTWSNFGLFRFLALFDPYGHPLPLIGSGG